VSFLSDYGLADGFVAACHGVLHRGAAGITIIDVSHLVPPGDVRRGSLVLAQTVGHLPAGVHLAVVDPGVGTARRALAVAADGGLLVGPDNGLLVPAATALGGVHTAVELPVPPAAPATFHGRDVFAPAAAALAAGRALAEVGRPVEPASLVRLPDPVARIAPGPPGRAPAALEAEAVLVDRFGNVQLAASGELLAAAGFTPGRRVRLTAAGGPARPVLVGTAFGSVPAGEAVLYVDSAGMAALAVNGADAATAFGLAPGDMARIEPG
jgi:S-adenosylmethionine hydrolase